MGNSDMLERESIFRLIPFILVQFKEAHRRGERPSPDAKWNTLVATLLIVLYGLNLMKLVDEDVLELCEEIFVSAKTMPIIAVESMVQIVQTGVRQSNISYFSSDESYGWIGPTSAENELDLPVHITAAIIQPLDDLAPLSDYDLIYLANDLWKREHKQLHLKGEKQS